MLSSILAFLGKMFASVFSEVIIDILKTPAKEISIETVSGDIDLPPTPVDELLHDWYEGTG